MIEKHHEKIIVLLIHIINILLFSQYEWSDPIQLSEQGIYPSCNYKEPAITKDFNGLLHSFWLKNIQIGSDLDWYTQIEYRKSVNNGMTWSSTENLTPDYSTERIYSIEVVSDSQNNIHLVYSRSVEGSSYSQLLHITYNGTNWSEPIEIYQYYTSALNIGIDKTDRLYALWYLGPSSTGTEYYSYCDAHADSITWRTAEAVDNTGSYGVRSQLIFDDENNLYCVGSLQTDDVYAYFFEYKRANEVWEHEQITEIGAFACALTISDNEELYAHVSIGGTELDNDNYTYFKLKSDSIWTDLGYINSDTNYSDKYLFTDNDDNFHLIESHSSYPADLLYSSYNNDEWINEILHTDSLYGYGYLDAIMENAISTIYLIYQEIDTTMLQFDTKIFFQSKKIFTSIEDSDKLAKDFELFQNYPNPFNPATEINYTIKDMGKVELSVFNSKGEFVNNLVNKNQNKGRYSVMFNGTALNSGVYYYRLKVDRKVKETRKMLYLR